MTFDLFSGLHVQIQTWHPPLWLCTHAKYYVKSGLTNVLKNANKTKNMHLFFRFGLPTIKGFGMEQVITQLAVKILFDDYSVFYERGGKLFYQRSRNNNRYCTCI